ncbi:MAG TPA: HD-GYP domain-containing protein [Gemmatimonadales bacterium]|jgi:HD-GYP domain-containing protein (c-di-GMP phosphodiesterase class II)|nr:HD-GYP domain-containing protein [Gemmatimonadales bacterium]
MTQPITEGAPKDGALRASGRGLLLTLYAALRSLKLYPVENATVQRALDDLDHASATLLEQEPEVEIRLSGDFIFVNSTRLRLELDNYASFSNILATLRTFDIGVLHIHRDVTRRDWQAFLSILINLAERNLPEPFDELAERFFTSGVHGLELERAQPSEDSLDEQARQRELAKRTYSHGVAVAKEVVTSVRLGKATSVKKMKRAVQLIVDQVLNNETSLMGLTTIRDYDEYTFQHCVNVCIFAVALGKKLGFSKLQLYDLGMTALMHDIGKARIPVEILNKSGGLDDHEWRVMQAHPWFGALTLFMLRGYEEIPYRSILVAHEHHMKIDLTGYPKTVRPREVGLFSRIVSVADGFDAATTRRSYQTVPIEPDQVLREMWENPRRGYDPVLVKAFINLIGIYPVGTCVILDTLEVGVVSAPNPETKLLNRPLVRLAIDADGGMLPPPGQQVDLAEQDVEGRFRRSIVKVTNPGRHGIVVGDFFV